MASSSGRRCISRYLQEISEYPILTKEDELALVRRLEDPAAGDSTYQDLVKSNLSFVVKIASEYRSSGLPFEDLLNEGNIGVIEAAQHFDPSRGTRFLTYAVWWIRKAILKAVSQHSALVHIPNYQLRRLRQVAHTGRQLSRELGREADREELSRELQVTIAKLDEILQAKPRELSLDDIPGRDQGAPLSDFLADERSTSPEDELIKHESQAIVRWALGRLNPLEQFVIINRFGLAGGRVLTLREVGEKLGVSRERIRQLETQAKDRLKRAIARRHRPGPSPRAVSKRWDVAVRPRIRPPADLHTQDVRPAIVPPTSSRPAARRRRRGVQGVSGTTERRERLAAGRSTSYPCPEALGHPDEQPAPTIVSV